MATMNPTWLALESNPETINPFLKKIGIKGIECHDVFSFEEDTLGFYPTPQLAVIACFPHEETSPYLSTVYDSMTSDGESGTLGVFFMKQTIENACGTFALFHALANLESRIDLGKGSFRKWLDTAKTLSVEDRSASLANDDDLAAAHQEAAEMGETDVPEADQVQHHFICYVNVNGTLYEIDSCAPFPRVIGNTTDESLLKDASVAIKDIISQVEDCTLSALLLTGK